jgi:hypothetical protein
MDTAHFTVRVESGLPLTVWTHEQAARLIAVETFEDCNTSRVINDW